MDAQLFAEFVRENENKFYRLAYSYVKDPDTAMDVVQDAVIRALQKLYTLRQPEYVKTWFYRILVNQCNTHLRRSKRNYILPLHEEMIEGETDEYIDSESLSQAILKLEPQLKTIIFLRFYEEMKLEEISKTTGVKLSTVKSRLYRALYMLRLDIDPKEGD